MGTDWGWAHFHIHDAFFWSHAHWSDWALPADDLVQPLSHWSFFLKPRPLIWLGAYWWQAHFCIDDILLKPRPHLIGSWQPHCSINEKFFSSHTLWSNWALTAEDLTFSLMTNSSEAMPSDLIGCWLQITWLLHWQHSSEANPRSDWALTADDVTWPHFHFHATPIDLFGSWQPHYNINDKFFWSHAPWSDWALIADNLTIALMITSSEATPPDLIGRWLFFLIFFFFFLYFRVPEAGSCAFSTALEMLNASGSKYDVKNGHDPVSLLPVWSRVHISVPPHYERPAFTGRIERGSGRFMEGCGGRTVCAWLVWKTGNP